MLAYLLKGPLRRDHKERSCDLMIAQSFASGPRVVYRLVKIADLIQHPVDYVGFPSNDKIESMPDARNCHVYCPYGSSGHALQPRLIDLDNFSWPLLIIHLSHIDTIGDRTSVYELLSRPATLFAVSDQEDQSSPAQRQVP